MQTTFHWHIHSSMRQNIHFQHFNQSRVLKSGYHYESIHYSEDTGGTDSTGGVGDSTGGVVTGGSTGSVGSVGSVG